MFKKNVFIHNNSNTVLDMTGFVFDYMTTTDQSALKLELYMGESHVFSLQCSARPHLS